MQAQQTWRHHVHVQPSSHPMWWCHVSWSSGQGVSQTPQPNSKDKIGALGLLQPLLKGSLLEENPHIFLQSKGLYLLLYSLTLWNTSSNVGRRSGASPQHCFITWMHSRGANSGAMFGRQRGGGFFTFLIISVTKRRMGSMLWGGGSWEEQKARTLSPVPFFFLQPSLLSFTT